MTLLLADIGSLPLRRLAAPFARVEVSRSLEAVASEWAELEAKAGASPYQSFGFVNAWFTTVGAARGAAPAVAVARTESGRAIALVPLAIRRFGPLAVASFPGGQDSNFNMGLFRPGTGWSTADIRAFLKAAGRAARIDAFTLFNQPLFWDGYENPLVRVGGAPSPSFGARGSLPGQFDAWLSARTSKAARKKGRQNAAALARMGSLAHVMAQSPAQAGPILDAFLTHRRALALAGCPANPYAAPPAQAFLRRLAQEGVLELHALTLDGRPVATFGGLVRGRGLSGLILSHDVSDREIARHGPGRLLITEVVRSAIARGLTDLDLGAGEAGYKDKVCPLPVPLMDVAFGVTAKGRAAAAAIGAARRTKRTIKRSSFFYALATRARRWFAEEPRAAAPPVGAPWADAAVGEIQGSAAGV